MSVRFACWLLCCGSASLAAAQASNNTLITVSPRSAFAEQVVDRLRAGLNTNEPDSTVITLGETSTPCEATAEATSASDATTIAVDITADGLIVVCTQTRGAINRRTVGPITVLDAAAAEQIATMVEASLEALDEPSAAATEEVTAEVTAEAPTETEVTAEVIALESPEPHAPVVEAASTPAPTQEADNSPRLYAVSLSVEPTLWDAGTLALGGRVGAQRSLAPSWLWFGIGVGYSLPFERVIDGLGARFSTLSVDARLGLSLPIHPSVFVDVSAGPRIEWLFVRPFVVPQAHATAGSNSYAFTTTGVIEAGPRVLVASHLWLTLRLGAIFVNQPRAYGFTRGESFITVMDQGIPRPYLQLGAQLVL